MPELMLLNNLFSILYILFGMHVYFIRKPFFCLDLNFLNIMLEIKLR